jgi:hypothetical protein
LFVEQYFERVQLHLFDELYPIARGDKDPSIASMPDIFHHKLVLSSGNEDRAWGIAELLEGT